MALFEINWKPPAGTLRLFGVLTGLFLAAIGAWAFFRHALLAWSFDPAAAQWTGLALWSAGAVMFLLAVTIPRALRPVYVLMNAAAFPIGVVVSHVILFVIYFGVFTPMGLVFRLIGRDALHRKFDPKAQTYWTAHDGHPPAKQYFRQF
jgi:hypothetical protein